MRLVPALALLFFFVLTLPAAAQMPRVISYQGVLTDDAGSVVPDGFYNVVFKLYEQEVGGAEVWSITRDVMVNKGIFNVALGSIQPLDIPFDKPYWLGMAVAGEPELFPRVQLMAVPYSMNSWGVTGMTNFFPPDGNVGIGTPEPQERLDVEGGIRIGGTDGMNPGTIRWSGADFEGFDGLGWRSFTAGDGSLPPGTAGQTLRHDGADWTASSLLCNNGASIGIGTCSPVERLHIRDTGPTYLHIDAPAGFSPGVIFSENGSAIWRLLYHPGEGTIQFFREGSGAKMVIGNGGRVGIGTTTLDGNSWLEVHSPNPTPGKAAIAGYSYFNEPPSWGGAIAVAGIHHDDAVGGVGVYGEATSGMPMFNSQVGVYGYTNDGYGVYSDGTLGATGPIVAVAPTEDFGHREVYSVQATGNWFEDFGEGRLSAGEARVEIDPVFAQTVNLGETYHVFLTPLGDCGLYVWQKTARSFTVRAEGGRAVDVAFDYRIVAKRSGFESKRLESAKDPVEFRQRHQAALRKTGPRAGAR